MKKSRHIYRTCTNQPRIFTTANENEAMLIDVEIARESDFGCNDKTCIVRSHLGQLLKVGDIVLGYDLEHSVIDEGIIADLAFSMQDVILVKKEHTHEVKEKGSNRKQGGRKKCESDASLTTSLELEDVHRGFEIVQKKTIELSDEIEEEDV